ncbi:MAG: hypothetical protein PUH24_07445 [Prevotellaceae bacterium]|nr:hypothetical protein [Prevotellaceae bacterium]MDY6131649.1 hypothetical protein [Prevotella sp.]
MKHLMTALLLCMAFVSCGNKQKADAEETKKADSTQTDSLANEVSQVKIFGNPQTDFYVATIQDDGSVTLKFNRKLCDKLAQSMDIPNRLGDETKVEGLAEKCKDIKMANLGNDVNPFLVMLTEKGHVAILSLLDALSTGDMTCSGSLHGLDNIVSLKEISDIDGQGVFAVTKDGEEEWVDSNGELEGYYLMDNFGMHLSRDWNITMSDTNIDYHHTGTFCMDHLRDADSPGTFTRSLVANINGKTCRIAVSHEDGGDNYRFTFKADKDFPLVQNKPLSFVRNDCSHTAD